MDIFDMGFEESGLELGNWMVVTGRCSEASVQYYRGEVLEGRMTIEECVAMPPSPHNVWVAEAAGEAARAADPALMHHDLFSEEGLARQRAQAELDAGGVQPDGRIMPTLIPRPIPRRSTP